MRVRFYLRVRVFIERHRHMCRSVRVDRNHLFVKGVLLSYSNAHAHHSRRHGNAVVTAHHHSRQILTVLTNDVEGVPAVERQLEGSSFVVGESVVEERHARREVEGDDGVAEVRAHCDRLPRCNAVHSLPRQREVLGSKCVNRDQLESGAALRVGRFEDGRHGDVMRSWVDQIFGLSEDTDRAFIDARAVHEELVALNRYNLKHSNYM